MNKDVIYIDVDDDITAIIGKIKASKERIIALVPPKRIGVLQSAVNLRLLDRMAKSSKKHLVIITNNAALIALTASARIPTARNLQSKPEIAEIPALAIDDGDDIIDGAELPVSDHIKSAGSSVEDAAPAKKPSKVARDDALSSLAIDGESVQLPDELPTDASQSDTKPKPTNISKSSPKIPNFNRFRKWLFLIILGIGGLTALLIWMFVFAPAATITITASTQPSPVSTSVTLGGTAATDFKKGIVSSLYEELKKDESIEFDATGEKNNGEKATGTVRFSTILITSLGTIPAGTQLTSASGKVFVTDADVVLTSSNYTGADVTVTAAEAGDDYNGASGNVSGAPSGVSARFVGSSSGGTSVIVKVVSDADVERAKGDLIGKATDAQKKELATKFGSDVISIESSFAIKQDAATSTPAVGADVADGKKAKLTIATTYSMYGVARSVIDSYLTTALKDKISGQTDQRVYDTGAKSAALSGFKKSADGAMTVTLTAKGTIGPDIDEVAAKDLIKGKITGDVQSALQSIDGIQDVSVQYSYFWVRTVPNDTNKITLEFKLEKDGS